MPIQNYNIYTAKGYAGDLCDSGPRVSTTGIAEVPIGFGLGLKRGTIDGQVDLGCVGSGNLYGIAMREYNHEAATRPSDGTTVYNPTESVSVFRQGYLYIELTGATNAVVGDAILVDTVTGEFGLAAGGNFIATVNLSADENLIVTGGTDILRVRMDIIHT